MSRFLPVLALLTACGGSPPPRPPAPAPAPAPAPDSASRPPGAAHLTVTRARLDLTLDPATTDLTGSIEIDLDLDAPTSELPVIAGELDLADATLLAGTRTIKAKPTAALRGVTILTAARPVGPGAATLVMAFRGTRPRGPVALLLPGTPRSFPFVDAPAARVRWQLTLRVPRSALAFSNAPLAGTVDGEDDKTLRFAETQPLGAARLAYAVGPFELVPAGTAGRRSTPLRFAVPRNRAAQARFLVEILPRALAAVEETLDAGYPAGKLDVVVLPAGSSGAAPGLLALDEPRALFDPEAPVAERHRVLARELARELAVSWSEALAGGAPRGWLAGALPEWLGARVAASLDPAWAVEPLAMSRGAAVLSTLRSWAGEARTLEALRAAWAGEDFFAVLDSDTTAPVAEAAQALAQRDGTPLLEAHLSCPRRGRPELELVQRDAPAWTLPVCVAYGAKGSRRRACQLVERSGKIPLDGPCPEWAVANAGGEGAWRVRHDADLLARAAAAGAAMGRGERRSLILDARALLAAGKLGLPEALALLAGVLDLDDPDQLDAATWILGQVRPDRFGPLDRARLTRFARQLFAPRARALGWRPISDEPYGLALLRPRVLAAAAILGDDRDLIRQAEALAERWFDDHRALHADIVAAVLRAAARGGSHPLFTRLRDAARASAPGSAERRWLLVAAGATPDLALANAALALLHELSIDDSYVVLEGLLAQPETRDLAWDFLRQGWRELRLGASAETARALVGLSRLECDPARRAAAEAFFAPKVGDIPGGREALGRALAAADACIAAEQRDNAAMVRFLRTLR